MAYRSFPTALRDSLYNNDPYIVAHLIKFEKPILGANHEGLSAQEATDYVYLTDAGYNIDFDDGTFSRRQQYQLDKDAATGTSPSTATPNGRQTYHANKVISVGTINEGIEAKASNLTLELDATILGATAAGDFSFSAAAAGRVTLPFDISEEGFKEGDTIKFTGAGTNNGLTVRINRFLLSGSDNQIDATLIAGSWNTESTASYYQVSLVSEEVSTLVLGADSVSYTNYINREVTIYRVHINPSTNAIIGGVPGFTSGVYDQKGAMLLFKGIISNASLDERPNSRAVMKWTLSSHWGDFVRVQNRLTNDDQHRALDQDGIPNKDVVIRPEYMNDLGFEHSELALNLTAKYNRTETRKKLVKKKNAIGYSKYREVEYEVQVPDSVDLEINLDAKALPVVYGIQKIDSIPFFFDNQKDAPNRVYVGYALCEGPVAGVLDIVIDDKTTICVDANDSEQRSSQTDENSVDIVCQGNKEAGQTLVGTAANQGVSGIYVKHIFNYSAFQASNPFARVARRKIVSMNNQKFWDQETALMDKGGVGTTGILHETSFVFRTPIDCTLTFHRGEADQRADSLLVSLANAEKFKVQNDFYSGDPHTYYTPNHRLLDTAYMVGEYLISEGETTIPSLDFVVRGKGVQCFNYDGSYEHNPSTLYNTEDHTNFTMDQTVFIKGTGITEYSTRIIDKWSFIGEDGVVQYRFRWATAPAPTGADVIMTENGGGSPGNTWTMMVADVPVVQGSTQNALEMGIDYTSGDTTVNSDGEPIISIDESDINGGVHIALQELNNVVATTKNGEVPFISLFKQSEKTGKTKLGFYQLSAKLQPDSYDSAQKILGKLGGVQGVPLVADVDKMCITNGIRIGTGNNAHQITDNRYVGHEIKLYRFDSDNVPFIQTRTITKWVANGTTAVAFVSEPWDPEYLPDSGDLYIISTPADLRVSLNPAMHLLDYMKSKRYGKGLRDEDIDLDTFKSAAVDCDTRSDVTLQFKTSDIPGTFTVGDQYRRLNTGHTHFRGKVKSVTAGVGPSDAYTQVVFTEVQGKISQKWRPGQVFNAGQILWYNSGGSVSVKKMSGSSGTSGTIDTVTAFNNLGLPDQVRISRIGGGNTVDADVAVDLNASGSGLFAGDGNPIVKAEDGQGTFLKSGYSLYDSDNIKYWRYVGWDDASQRNATRHQLNHVVDTTKTIFSNINEMLTQFNGVLRYSNGKYQLSVKGSTGAASQYETINEEDIIGDIKISDKGSKKTYNSIATSIIDPANNFEPRQVSFFNSDYLKQDNGVPKKGNFKTPAITNYFNARFGLKQFLDESRNGLELQFKLRTSGLLLLAGEVIEINYKSFGWTNKKWRITNLNFNSDGTVNVTCTEHTDDAYIVANTEDAGAGGSKGGGDGQPIVSTRTVEAPSGLQCTANSAGGILVEWANASSFTEGTHTTEVYRAPINDINLTGITTTSSGANTVTVPVSSISNIYVGATVGGVSSTNLLTSGNYESVPSIIKTLGTEDWNTIAGTSGIIYNVGDSITPAAGQAGAGSTGGVLQTNNPVRIRVTAIGTNDITVNTKVTFDNSAALTFTAPKVLESSGDSILDPLQDINEGPNTFYYWVRHKVLKPIENVAGSPNRVVFSTFFPSTQTGVQGVATVSYGPRSVSLTSNIGSQFFYDADGLTLAGNFPTSATMTATAIGTVATPSFKFEVLDAAGAVISSESQSSFSTTNTFTFNAPTHASNIDSAYNSFPRTIKVTLQEVLNGSTITATDEFPFVAAKYINDGVNVNIVATNNDHKFFGNDLGEGASNDFSSTFSKVSFTDGTTKALKTLTSYDGTSPYGTDTYRYGTARDVVDCSVAYSSTGVITIAGSSEILEDNSDHLSASFAVPIINNADDKVIGIVPFNLAKVLGDRADQDFFFEDTVNSQTITTTDINNWTGTFSSNTNNNGLCEDILTAILAISGISAVNPGDTVNLSRTASNKAATRIYIGKKRTSATGVNANDFSDPVVKRFDGSVIVDGTLKAETLESDSTITNQLNVTNNLILGTSGAIFSTNKTSFSDNDAGFFLGWDSSAHKLNIGDSTNFMKWDGSTLNLQSHNGGFSLKSSTSSSADRVEITSTGIEIYEGSNLRVKIGDLS